MIKRSKKNICPWFKFVESTNRWIVTAVADFDALAHRKRSLATPEGSNYNIRLSHVKGGVVTRLPPEPSGFLRVGHAKAALLVDFLARGKGNWNLICPFDVTNPSEELQEFEDSIVDDL
ncbi:hypothetical protein HO173_004831 [Letharia columbiana]|uniref:Glutamyl/glutaminyl-tRNA synthetase class Ib catalytic domain-containing protein n=1 Tax=Letharia columbiana TaxID=112416 RepID=A0A8H6L650_9LECA|nr:uncharacterized protein HO173_004831 [Letharia columbiana]KAF6236952.1 hypothetical protein HO173_004831 [Letharia columbiana]